MGDKVEMARDGAWPGEAIEVRRGRLRFKGLGRPIVPPVGVRRSRTRKLASLQRTGLPLKLRGGRPGEGWRGRVLNV